MQFNIPAEHKHASGVYIIRNSINSKVYVGSAVDFWKRFRKHRSELRNNKHHSARLQRFATKYGEDALHFGLLELTELERQYIIECEQKWIDCLECCKADRGFNIAPIAGSSLGVKHSAESRAARTGKPRSEETKRRIAEGRKGIIIKPFTPEQRERQKEGVGRAARARKGTPATPWTAERREQHRVATSVANKARGMTEEHKQKLSLDRKGKKRDPAIGAKISAALSGKKADGIIIGRRRGTTLTVEQKQSISAAKKGKSTSTPESEAKRKDTIVAKRTENPLFMRGPKPPLTAEHRQKLSDGAKAQWARQRAA